MHLAYIRPVLGYVHTYHQLTFFLFFFFSFFFSVFIQTRGGEGGKGPGMCICKSSSSRLAWVRLAVSEEEEPSPARHNSRMLGVRSCSNVLHSLTGTTELLVPGVLDDWLTG